MKSVYRQGRGTCKTPFPFKNTSVNMRRLGTEAGSLNPTPKSIQQQIHGSLRDGTSLLLNIHSTLSGCYWPLATDPKVNEPIVNQIGTSC